MRAAVLLSASILAGCEFIDRQTGGDPAGATVDLIGAALSFDECVAEQRTAGAELWRSLLVCTASAIPVGD